MNILFVCTGNTCRSFMSEAIFGDIISKGNKNDILASSAGISAWEGEPASANAIAALKEKGIETGQHRARKITGEMVDAAQLILCMTKMQKRNLVSFFPHAKDRIYTINEYAYNDDSCSDCREKDVSDPYGMPLETYKKCLEELSTSLEKIFRRLA